jgi:surfeit locus 1 family protein
MDHVPSQHEHDAYDRRGRSPLKRVLATALAGVLTLGFLALGVWQLDRLAWKRDLVARVDARVHAARVPLSPAMWRQVDEYRRVTLVGRFDFGRETLVQALTEHGAGFWVMTPLQTRLGTVLINRGFVPPERRDPATRAEGRGASPAVVTGLARVSEPGGGFLRANDAGAGRWDSRDVVAIARARHLGSVAPFFVDADATPNPGGYPVGGLTIVRFRDNHLVYALTWFGLAVLSAFAGYRLVRERQR